MNADDFSDVLDMEYLLLSDTSSIADRNDSKNSDSNCEFVFCRLCPFRFYNVRVCHPCDDIEFLFKDLHSKKLLRLSL